MRIASAKMERPNKILKLHVIEEAIRAHERLTLEFPYDEDEEMRLQTKIQSTFQGDYYISSRPFNGHKRIIVHIYFVNILAINF